MKRAIITGATGAIGTALVSELISQNVEVLILYRKGSKRLDNIPKSSKVTLRECALEELEYIKNDTGKEYDVFYHFAWEGTVGDARNDMYLQNQNVKYALDAVGAAKRFGCKMFIGAGSQAEYGRFEGNLKSSTPTFPEMGYGIAKLCAGQMTRIEAHTKGMAHIWVRILSVYGPYDGNSSMVMSTIDKLKRNITPKFTKAEQIWDYLYSGDAARAFFLLSDRGVDGKIYVLGNGQGRPLREYIEIIRNVVDSNAKLEIGAMPYAPKQVMYLCADNSEIENDLGWKPQILFEEGIRKIIDNKM